MARLSPYLLTTSATCACAVAGSLASDPDSSYYKDLTKPAWNPPNWFFPLAWTSLYACIAGTSGYTLARLKQDGNTEEAGRYSAALATNLALNASWSYTFFRSHRLGLATAHAGVLALSSADLVRRTARISKSAGALLAPYAGWTAFATALSGSIWWLNNKN